jgi:hypothetical protein
MQYSFSSFVMQQLFMSVVNLYLNKYVDFDN